MFLDMFTEAGVYVKKGGKWRRYALAHFRYNNPLAKEKTILLGGKGTRWCTCSSTIWGFTLPSRLWGDSDKGFKFVKVSFTPEGIAGTI